WWRNNGELPLDWEKSVLSSDFSGAIYVYVADVNIDGYPDILGAAWNDAEISWWENDGENQEFWEKHLICSNFTQAHEVYACDLDMDGDTDILGASAYDNEIAWWENTGQNTLVWSKHVVAGDFNGARSIAVGDLDGDEDNDIVGAALLDNEVACWLNHGSNQLSWDKVSLDTTFLGSHKVDIVDMDGDEDPDILGTAYGSNEISWWCNNGPDPGDWDKYVVDNVFGGAVIAYASDFDRDGDIDVVGTAQGSNQVAWWENSGVFPHTWTKHQLKAPFPGAWPLHYGDIDNDGDIDVVAGGRNTSELRWWENSYYGVNFQAEPTSGHFPLEVSFTDDSNFAEPVITWQWDFNNDGIIDSWEQNPVWSYQEPGMYSVSLTVHTQNFSKYILKEDLVAVFNGDSALRYDQTGSYSLLEADPDFNLNTAFSLEFWLYPFQSSGYYKMILDKQQIKFFINVSFPVYNQNSYVLQITHTNGSISRAMSSENTVVYDQWQHVAFTYDGLGEAGIFLNGAGFETEYLGEPSGTPADNEQYDLYIGNSSDLYYSFQGLIDEIRIWDHVRTDYDILNYMFSYLSGSNPGLIANWQFNEAYGEFFYDNADHQEPGTIYEAFWGQGFLLLPAGTPENSPLPGIEQFMVNVPNPFNGGTTIFYNNFPAGELCLSVYDIKGRRVEQTSFFEPDGSGSIQWPGEAETCSRRSSGIYLYNLAGGLKSLTRKMILLK
ncbi:MAG: VCBS repeat-containing protein, partial [Candidatus Cloacimonetes bacterium]|nr:VCBS repeat-containing protein [Candidatus Cloacimonadota bacterium]